MSKMRLIEAGVGALGGGLIGSALGGMGKKPLNPYSPTPEETEKLRRGKQRGMLTGGIFSAMALPLSAKMRIARMLKNERKMSETMRRQFFQGVKERSKKHRGLNINDPRDSKAKAVGMPAIEGLRKRRARFYTGSKRNQQGKLDFKELKKAREGSFMGGGKNLGRKVTMKQLFGDLNTPYSTVKENLDNIYDRPIREALSKLIT